MNGSMFMMSTRNMLLTMCYNLSVHSMISEELKLIVVDIFALSMSYTIYDIDNADCEHSILLDFGQTKLKYKRIQQIYKRFLNIKLGTVDCFPNVELIFLQLY